MKSIKRRYEIFANKSEGLGSYVILARAVKSQGFNRETINRWFKELVSKDEYERSNKIHLINHLVRISKSTAEDAGFLPKNGLRQHKHGQAILCVG